jgi:hypothetical protein
MTSKADYINTIERARKSCHAEEDYPYLGGIFERLVALLDPRFDYVVEPKSRQRLERILVELEAAKTDWIYLFTLVARLHWQQQQFSRTTGEIEIAHMSGLFRAFLQADLGTFQSLLRAVPDYLANAVYQALDIEPPRFAFNRLVAQLKANDPALPTHLTNLLTATVLEYENFHSPLNFVRNEILHNGARELAWSDKDWNGFVQVQNRTGRNLIAPATTDLPEELFDGNGMINAEVYFGACLARMVCFLNEFACEFLRFLIDSGDITVKAVLDLRDVKTYDVLQGRGIPDEELHRLRGPHGGGGTVEIDQTPAQNEHHIIGTPSALYCMDEALKRLEPALV